MTGVGQASSQLRNAWARLTDQWQATADRWHDLVRQRFERDFLQEYERAVPLAIREMDQLADLLAQARREVL